jgi:hypothetical protein
MFNRIINKLASKKSSPSPVEWNRVTNEIENARMLAAKALINFNRGLNSKNIQDYEFKVFSQWGDDGIIQHLINTIEIPHRTFIEFGVQDYTESNTRFLLINNNWRGLIMDSSTKYINSIRRRDYYWKYDLKAKEAFITAENINDLIGQEELPIEVGIYHIDIDGNDYWIWKATTSIRPIIVITEYQSLFGCERAVTIPYKSDFNRTDVHYSNLFYGASLLSLCDLAKEKGYCFVGCNSAGNNAYFVREDKVGSLKVLTASDGYVLSNFREARDAQGNLLFLSGAQRQELIKGLQVFNTRLGKIEAF